MRQSSRASLRLHAALAALMLVPLGACVMAQTPAAASLEPGLRAAVAAPTRTPANVARDSQRHPGETLAFFDVEPDDTVVEVWPGGGWYTEILAPYLSNSGQLYVAAPAGRGADNIAAKLASDTGTYGKVRMVPVTPGTPSGVPAGSADVVLTFRNVHNWIMAKDPHGDAMFAEMFRMLKPGGTLGIVDHRLPETADAARERSSGYLKVSTVRALAEKAGFEFVDSSEVNANPKDTADWPQGVWTLPPTYRLGDTDRPRYQAIGESDRMTLRFRKPG